MTRAFDNLKKKGGQKSQGGTEAHLRGLENRWKGIEARHIEILALQTKDNTSVNYLQTKFIETCEDTYYTEKGKFLDHLSTFNPSTYVPPTTAAVLPEGQTVLETRRTRHKLPPIEVQPFSGKYSEWSSFKDYISALIANDPELEDVERLHYLKSFLRGDAANLVKNIPVTTDNYDRAWTRLKSYYDNTRNLIQQCLDSFLQLKPMTVESPHALKQLRDGATETIETLEGLGRPAGFMNDFMVHLTVQRFDPVTRRDWEFSLGGSTTVSWKELETFMTSRIQALERAEPRGSTMLDATRRAKQALVHPEKRGPLSNPKLSVHHISSSKPATCSLCQADHFIAGCSSFRACSLESRYQFVTDNQLCFNCLGPHSISNCRSKKSCTVCHRRHHTLIHRPQSSAVDVPGSLPPAPSFQPVTLHAIKIAPSRRAMILATARVTLSSELQSHTDVRALVDPCSEDTFISESLAQHLKIPRQSAFVPVTGVGGTPCQTVKTQATVFMSPRLNRSQVWRLRALILPRLTDYWPTAIVTELSWSIVQELQLADPHPDSIDPIEMIIGADIFPQLIQEGLKKSADGEVIAQLTSLGWIITGSLSSQLNSFCTNRASSQGVTSHQIRIDEDLSDLLERFWHQEDINEEPQSTLTAEEIECEKHFASTHRRTSEGRYVLRLPFKQNISDLGDSYSSALSMLQPIERRFESTPELYEKYCGFLEEYATLSHMQESFTQYTQNHSRPDFSYLTTEFSRQPTRKENYV